MAVRRCKSQIIGNMTVRTLVLASIATLALPAFASTVARKSCPSTEKATLSVSTEQLVANNVSHDVAVPRTEDPIPAEVSAHDLQRNLLAPRAEAAIREAFEDSDTKLPAENTIDVKLIESILQAPPLVSADSEDRIEKDADEQPSSDEGMKTVLPGVAEDELSQFKKVMFRRDI